MKRVIIPFALLFMVMLALQLLATFDSSEIILAEILNPPSTQHLLGSDELGRDVLSRLAHAVQVSLKVGIIVLLIAGSIGATLGIISGYFGGIVDTVLMRITDIFLSFPGILIAISFAALAGPGVENVILALGLMGWVSFARLARVETLKAKTQDYVAAAALSGVKTTPILLRYILPNISAPLIIESVFTVAGAMIAEAGLSFLGIGIQPPEPSLGTMLREGARYMLVAPHLVLVPGCSLMILVLTLNVTADRLRDWLDVRYSNDHDKHA